MKFTTAAILALGITPTFSFSYLESLGSAPPTVSAPAPAVEPPFFFTNGAKEEPDETPEFFFTDGPTGFAPAPAAASSSGYLDFIGSGTTDVSGPGMASYLDALPKSASLSSGPGLASYASELNEYIASAPPEAVAELAAPTIPAPAEAYVPAEPAGPVAAGSNYLDDVGSSSTAGTPSGAGLVGYLDALPAPAAAWGGAGIQSYTDGLPITNTVAGTGVGMSSYTNDLSGGEAAIGKSYTPFVSKPTAPAGSFDMGTTTGRFDFSIVADPQLLAQLEASNGRPIRLSGKASFN